MKKNYIIKAIKRFLKEENTFKQLYIIRFPFSENIDYTLEDNIYEAIIMSIWTIYEKLCDGILCRIKASLKVYDFVEKLEIDSKQNHLEKLSLMCNNILLKEADYLSDFISSTREDILSTGLSDVEKNKLSGFAKISPNLTAALKYKKII